MDSKILGRALQRDFVTNMNGVIGMLYALIKEGRICAIQMVQETNLEQEFLIPERNIPSP